jgi:hypothetical protein
MRRWSRRVALVGVWPSIGLMLFGAGETRAQQPQIAPEYTDAATAYEAAAAKTSCPQNKACYMQFASYYRNQMAPALGPGGHLPGNPPSCQIVNCPQDANAVSLFAGGGQGAPATAGGGGAIPNATPPPVQKAVDGLTSMVSSWADAMNSRAEADFQATRNHVDRAQWAQKQEDCFVQYNSRRQRLAIQAHAGITCAVRFRVLPRMPDMTPPPACDDAPMRRLLAGAAKAVLDGDLAAARDRYTQAWLANPKFEAAGIARALLLEVLGDPGGATAIAPYAATLRAAPAWSPEALAQAKTDEAACVQQVLKLPLAGPEFTTDPCKGH